MKFLTCIVLSATMAACHAAGELDVFVTDADGTRRDTIPATDGQPQDPHGALQVTGETTVMGSNPVEIKTDKTYRLSGWFRSTGDVPCVVYFGLRPTDQNGEPILPVHINTVESTETELAGDVHTGDTQLRVRDGSRWEPGPSRCVAFLVDPSGKYADLPNRNLSSTGILDVVKAGNEWVVRLASPMAAAYGKGAKVRQHLDGEVYIYCAAVGKSPPLDEFELFEGTIQGSAMGFDRNQFWPGTASVVPVVLANYGQGREATVAITDVGLAEED